ncbi:hypothetical protein [Streptomyces griseocarneus]|uniref:hypothetical protein n=1 Tax=Streptomyces griseocarneus TaxID=51201 RepID=UPI00167E53F2|nr:hypothetical protein [Streptomyces griseocarneus]MBZ6474473.1 hypothetical protein [Streptomyces griseocarneus]GHG68089.1 hypothetical protein GCM10018779_40550 [Streptomyces griseocarneus]
MHRPTDDPPHHHPDPAVLGALLARHGWRRRGGAPGRYNRWTPPAGPGNGTSLLVPVGSAFPDSADLLTEALAALEHSAAPSAREVLIALHTPSDEIRWHREIPGTRAPAAAWADQERLRTGARAMLLAGALAARTRAGHHGARRRRQAEAALAPLLLGPAPGGSDLAVFLPLEAPAGTGRATGEGTADGGDRLAATLLRALQTARDATDYRRATGRADAFDTAVEAGVCRELTDAVVTLTGGSQGIRITVEWAPAAGPPKGFAARPEPVEFSPGDLPALREAGARYVRDEPSVPVRVTGAVVRLRRETPGGAGVVRLRVLEGADVTQVRVALGGDDYRVAGHAHLAGLPVRVSGRLESRGGFRRLAGAHSVTPVPVDEAERDGLLKSLLEAPDDFGPACGGE